MLIYRINVLQQLAHENQMKAAGRQMEYHDAHAKAHEFKKGDKVWMYKASTVRRSHEQAGVQMGWLIRDR